MANIKIEYDTPYPAQETFSKLKEVLASDPDLNKLDPDYSCDFNENNYSGTAKGKKFTAELRVEAINDNSSRFCISLKLALLVRPFTAVVEKTLKKKVQKALG